MSSFELSNTPSTLRTGFKLCFFVILILSSALCTLAFARSNTSGDVEVSISGLPGGALPAVVVVQLNGDYALLVEGSGVFTDLAVGEYVIAAVPVTVGGIEYREFRQAATRIWVSPNTSQSVRIVYQRSNTTTVINGPVSTNPVTLTPVTPTGTPIVTPSVTPTPVTVFPFPDLPILQPNPTPMPTPTPVVVEQPVLQPQPTPQPTPQPQPQPTPQPVPITPTVNATGDAVVSLGQGSNSIGGMVFHDSNNNGINDPRENPVAGMRVFLDINQNSSWDSNEPLATTDTAGFYRFDGLANRRYTVMQSLPFSWSNTTAAQQGSGLTPGGQQPPEIVGGSFARFEDYPFITALALRRDERTNRGTFPRGQTWCGGSLIAGNWVMTAAHCVYNSSDPNVDTPFDFPLTNQNLSIFIGGNQIRNQIVDVNMMIDVVNIIIHPQYNAFSLDNDIALLQLARPVYFSRALLPDPGVQQQVYTPNGRGTILGWGDTQANDGFGGPPPRPSEFLQKAEVLIWDQRSCASLSAYRGAITGRKFCAGYQQGLIDSCQGDSGGPLVVSNQNSWYQAGIVSTGLGCAQPNQPGVYTRVSEFIDWIFQNAGPEVSQKVDVDFTGSSGSARVDFGNFR